MNRFWHDLCPYCHSSHAHYPTSCAERVEQLHLRLCGACTSTHHPHCLREAMQAYVARWCSEQKTQREESK